MFVRKYSYAVLTLIKLKSGLYSIQVIRAYRGTSASILEEISFLKEI